jgi:hypothetical protein
LICYEKAANLARNNNDGCELKYRLMILEHNVKVWSPLAAVFNFQECFEILITSELVDQPDKYVQQLKDFLRRFAKALA